MSDLIVGLLPPAFGIVASPLAIMALIAVLLSPRARVNGVMYFIGWAVAVVLTVSVAYAVFGALEIRAEREPPLWVPFVRLLLGVVLLSGAVWAHSRGRARVVQMSTANSPEQVVDASPRLPGWLQAVAKFSGVQSLLLGRDFLLNPVDLSCAIVAGFDIRLAEIAPGSEVWYIVGFALVGILPSGSRWRWCW